MSSVIESSIADMIAAANRLDTKGLIIGKGGNLSLRLDEREILITASGYSKARLTPELITRVDLEGVVLSGLKPARDIRMHLEIYRALPGVKAIVHSHPTVATGLSLTDADYEHIFLPEVLMELGPIQSIGYAVPTTEEVPELLHQSIDSNPKARAFILERHGTVTCSEEDIWDAAYKLELLESTAKMLMITRLMDNLKPLAQDDIERTMRLLGLH